MSNPLIYSAGEIRAQIPSEILYAAFNIDEQPATINLSSIDDKILRKCIRPRVLVDCNVVRGVELIIPLDGIAPQYYEPHYSIYNISPELTFGREIMSVLNLVPMLNYNNIAAPGFIPAANPLLNVANRIGDSASTSTLPSNTHLELVAYNTILVYANYLMLRSYGFRVVLENDNNLQNISPRSYKTFSYLCVLAVKAYIYNKLIIPINQGYLASGVELGAFKTIIDSYADAEELYRVHLNEKWRAVAWMNDTTSYTRLVRSMLNPSL